MHTPGPWVVTYKKENPICIHGSNGDVIVEINDLYDNNNINLIAAAPELLEVLIELVECIQEGYGIIDLSYPKEVIAKAKGE